MKTKYVACVTGIIVIALMVIGIIYKSSYKDYNEQVDPLDDFVIGLMPDELGDIQITKMDKQLDNSSIIIAAECVDTPLWRFGCITERVKVKRVFKGNGLQAGDVIDVAREANCIFSDIKVDGMASINMSFVRAMIPGEIYLIFLDEKLMLRDADNIYDQSAEFLIAPIFCYNETESVPYKSISVDGNEEIYINVKESEFFLMSEKTIEQMYNLKSDLLTRYSLEGDNDD